ncbi:hypothetical protein COU00_03260 [Candidatus Falkowbacteria bacterium CG10_big_fil_rev_8_21_14_0_10_43_11]|uniref:Uncharacterized protein n=1 Tax=Candidatus Falkowbacteria bacterium CG10_big_fil_rev_8_21_14_0_10_43_11 TaxID=1974568 RepID=A0A2M6WLE3_9BACT|nr:MAG: hypothetical protein COU00_03260 [Candidatus Falkowbacteria bacterium CG10_big_fil_rev_8_21_14_0_10_43_11]
MREIIKQKDIPQTPEEAADFFTDGRQEEAMEFLRQNPEKSSDFCLAIKDCYQTDTTTVVLQIADALERALKGKE